MLDRGHPVTSIYKHTGIERRHLQCLQPRVRYQVCFPIVDAGGGVTTLGSQMQILVGGDRAQSQSLCPICRCWVQGDSACSLFSNTSDVIL